MIAYSVKKPITVLMGILIVIVLGVFSVTRLPITLFPDINLPFVVTITTYEGANPEEVESQVARRIESSVSTIGNFESVSSISNEHFGISIVTFAQSANMDSVVIELREILNNISFAEGVGNTRILRLSPDMLPVMVVTLFRSYGDENLTSEEALIRNTQWITRDIMADLQSISGVADVSLSGESNTVLQINLDDDQLALYGLTHQGVLATIENQNVGGLIGVALDDGELRMLYLGNQPANLAEIKALPIIQDGGEVITLEELSLPDGIKYVNSNVNVYSKVNGEQGIQISFQKQSDVSITEVTKNIQARLDQIVSSDTEDANYMILLDQGEFITQSINSVLQNIIIGGILAIIILFVFLKDVKPTLIVGLAIPISVIAAFMLMYFTNVSLNLISMGGLALGIGMLVDNAVVVIENIFRMISLGVPKKEAAIEGSRQVAGAITASTLTTVAVFLPLFFIEGLISEVFISMALTIAFSLGASLAIALTLVPSMSAHILNDQVKKSEGKFITLAKNWYKNSVLFTLKYKALTLITVVVLLVASFAVVWSKGFILLPESDEGTISISIEVATQSAFSDKTLYADEITDQLLDIEDIETVSASIGSGGMFGGFMGMMMGSGDIRFTINLENNRKNTTESNRLIIDSMIREIDFSLFNLEVIELTVSAQNSTQGFGGAQGINIKVSGYDLFTLEAIANDITTIVAETEGVKNADNGINQGLDNLKITINKTNAMKLDMTSQDVSAQINYLYQGLSSLGQTQSLNMTIEGIKYTVEIPSESLFDVDFADFGSYVDFMGGIMLFDAAHRVMIENYLTQEGASLYLPNYPGLPWYNALEPTGMIINPFLKVIGGQVVLDPFSAEPALKDLSVGPLFDFDDIDNSVATITLVSGFASIYTDGSNRYLTVTAQVVDGMNITLISQAVNRNVTTYLQSEDFEKYGSGYYVTFEGENEEIFSAISDLAIAALVAVLLVYMIMAIQFQSLVYPLIILGTIPLAFTGGLLALIVTNSYLSLVSIMGLIILIGIVVNNGIVLIDYINKLREKGTTIIEAIVEAGQTRLRPILMTALTTILALFTLSLGFGEGAELLQPMAITAIGGLIYATLLTLVVVPTIYALLNQRKIKKEMISDATDET